MFCGNCGAQVPDGSSVCPNCGAQMAPKSQTQDPVQSAQYQNNQYQNPQGGSTRQTGAGDGSSKKISGKLIGIICACVAVAVLAIVLVFVLGGSGGPKGAYTDGEVIAVFEKGRMSFTFSGMEMSFKYTQKKDQIIVDPESMELSDNFWEVVADSFGVDEDELEDSLEELAEYSEYGEALYDAYKDDDMDALIEMLLEEMDVDEDEFIYVYDKKTNTLKNKETKEKMFYAQQYKEGPSGKYTNKDDDDITMTFKNGTVTYDNDGDDEQFTYYVYVDKKDVYVVFYGEEFDESDFYDEYHVSGFSFNAKKDKFTIGGTDYKK